MEESNNQKIEIYMEKTVDLMIEANAPKTLEFFKDSEQRETITGVSYLVKQTNETEN